MIFCGKVLNFNIRSLLLSTKCFCQQDLIQNKSVFFVKNAVNMLYNCFTEEEKGSGRDVVKWFLTMKDNANCCFVRFPGVESCVSFSEVFLDFLSHYGLEKDVSFVNKLLFQKCSTKLLRCLRNFCVTRKEKHISV